MPDKKTATATTDEDLFDISDSDLIRASQAIEAELRIVNNTHAATNNAMNIFSQFSQAPPTASSVPTMTTSASQIPSTYQQNTQQQHHHHHHNHHHQQQLSAKLGGSMPPSTYSATAANLIDMSDEEVRNEALRLRGELMQKDGEVNRLNILEY